ncbi:hypothetical protein VW23_016045 [Devosia insulae DS-56]|uniref:DNA-binding protein n=1 Tax=Devosia insulae DS-56 TaxID=1116389 RepID=A0A1E5XS54_9HYPH|nr:hypothetical protein [Devosia insulae]OEO31420.1 hypothetical protein VW23_016045 [Devosia insulae DS-56]
MSSDRPIPNIGRPATQALELAGITTLGQVARRHERELLALHGVGPKAIRILRAELEAHGMQFAEPAK